MGFEQRLICVLISRGDFGQEVDEKHTVVATARGVFDGEGGVLESRETGEILTVVVLTL